MNHRLRALGAGLLLVAGRVSAQDFGPVPAAQIAGRVLTASEANFTVEAPDESWAWSVAAIPDGHVYACRRASDDIAFLILHQADGRRRMSGRALERFLTGVTQSLQKQGFRVTGMTHAEAGQPFPGAYRFRAALHAEDSAADRVVGFAGARDGLYSLTAVLGADADEQLFGRFAESFRLLRPVPTFPRLTIGFMLIDAVLLALAWLGLPGFAVPPLTRSVLAWVGALLGVLAVVAIGVFARAVVMGTHTPDQLDEVLGRFGAVALGIAGAGIIARAVRART